MPENAIENLQKDIQNSKFDAVVLNPGPTLTYLTGLNFHLMERPVIFIIPSEGRPTMVLPELEKGKLEGKGLASFTYGDNPETWQNVFNLAMVSLSMAGKKIGVEPTRLRFLELNILQQAAFGARFLSAEHLLSNLRMKKSEVEIEKMRKAVRIAEKAFVAVLKQIRPGMTEKEAASELSLQMLKAGCDAELPFPPIVAGGPNSANPHAVPTDRAFANGDLVIIDWGASYEGYFSDLTRNLAIGELDEEYKKIASLVHQANAAGRSIARPGISAGEVDLAARAVIERGGYGPFFNHRLGHGLGLEAHEQPYIFSENDLSLAEGMTFTIEPGIYLAGRGGVRIEDDVVITSTGCECLSSLPRELYFIS
ncbi:MAG: M24 family metallopeptidase [Anaerolineaceae bacterium]